MLFILRQKSAWEFGSLTGELFGKPHVLAAPDPESGEALIVPIMQLINK